MLALNSESFAFADAEGRFIRWIDQNGVMTIVPVDPANRDYRKISERGVDIAPYVPPPPPGPSEMDVLKARVAALEALMSGSFKTAVKATI